MAFADAKNRFSNRVADYVRYRPSYPPALIGLLETNCGLTRDHIIADVGSGTGLLTKLFLDYGNSVHGVEPNEDMRAAGEEYLRSHPKFKSVKASAESTTLHDASVDFVTVGQAFHWFDASGAQREFRRILKPGGWAVVVWQDRHMEDTAFASAYEGVLEKFGLDYKKVKDSYPEVEKMANFFDAGSYQTAELPNAQSLDWEALQGRLRSSSYAPTAEHANFVPMMAELRQIFEANERDGKVVMEYFARVYFGKLDGGR
jgi:ubiquinone/menaquinone biosynthesis C-methylase UbiE